MLVCLRGGGRSAAEAGHCPGHNDNNTNTTNNANNNNNSNNDIIHVDINSNNYFDN